jgi:hypothetical protein
MTGDPPALEYTEIAHPGLSDTDTNDAGADNQDIAISDRP